MVCSVILFTFLGVTAGLGAPKPVVPALPAIFEPNHGQAPEGVRFISRGARQTLLLTDDAVVVAIRDTGEQVRMTPIGASKQVQIHGLKLLAGKSSYLKGTRSEWVTGIPQFERVRYPGLYPGIDAVFYGTQKQLEYDLVVIPGSDPGVIQFHVEGLQALSTSEDGELIMTTAKGELRWDRPFAYQQDESGRHQVPCEFALVSADSFGFRVGGYDKKLPLVIDPSLFSTYLGGRDTDIPAAATTDAQGNIYITGYTASTNFPVSGVNYKGTLTAGDADAFVMKLDATASSVIYATYLGGPDGDYGKAITVDSTGAAYITGQTIGRFPTTGGAFSETTVNAPTIFVTKLNVAGNGLVYSTYLKGSGSGQAIALDASGNAYVAGFTYTATFPTSSGAFQQTYGGSTDAFVAKLNATGSSQVFSTFLGGSAEDQAMGLKLDSGGAMYVTGFTNSSNFPVTAGAFRTTYSGSTDVFVTKIAATGSTLQYSTFIGGPNTDRAYAIDISPAGEVYVAGQTFSSSFPTTSGALRTTHGGASDAFVSKLNAAGTGLVYSTFLGGDGSCTVSDSFRLYQCDAAYAVVVDSSGQAFVGGLAGAGFPLVGAPQNTAGGNGDAFLAQLNAAGSGLILSTYAGGSAGDVALALTNSTAGGPVIAGFTSSSNFPATAGSLQPASGGAIEGFATRLGSCSVTLGSTSSFFPQTAGSYLLDVFASGSCGWQATSDVDWVTVTSGTGSGNGQISYSVAANFGPLRVGHITVNGATFTLQQVSGACVTLGSTNSWFPAEFNGYFLLILATCSWSATTPDSWISITTPAGTGNYLMNFVLSANTTGSARTGHISVNGQVLTVNQVGAPAGIACSYSLSSGAEAFSATGGSRSILVMAAPGCEWSTSNPNAWITVTAGHAGSGEGVLGISVAANKSGQARIGQLTVAGQTLVVTQPAN